ncbi:MAG: hexosyltransferase, partial [Eubacterium sp.]|nr:hexosyltransferase [Eubacterium sp.]
MKKIAIINQRYGAEVNGGSESYTKLIAEHLRSYFDVTVLTTTAINYDTWKNEYPAGPEKVNGVRVLRFPIRRERSMQIFRIVNKCTFALKKIHIHTDRMWVNAQGPE